MVGTVILAIHQKMLIFERSDKEEIPPEDVDKLGHLQITCPKCGNKFKKGD